MIWLAWAWLISVALLGLASVALLFKPNVEFTGTAVRYTLITVGALALIFLILLFTSWALEVVIPEGLSNA